MVGVFSIIATLPMLDVKEFGVGLAAAVLIDATIVRVRPAPHEHETAGRLNLCAAVLGADSAKCM
jgi:RND superfamily putative drug exporter